MLYFQYFSFLFLNRSCNTIFKNNNFIFIEGDAVRVLYNKTKLILQTLIYTQMASLDNTSYKQEEEIARYATVLKCTFAYCVRVAVV